MTTATNTAIELTNAEIIRVFAMYMPCKVHVPKENYWTSVATKNKYPNDGTEDLQGIDCREDGGMVTTSFPDAGFMLFYPDEIKLLLTPLSSISDEHAIEVAKIAALYDYGDETAIKDAIKDGRLIAHHLIKRNPFLEAPYAFVYLYLLSQSYAVPLFFAPNHPTNGKNAIDLNLAIDKTTL